MVPAKASKSNFEGDISKINLSGYKTHFLKVTCIFPINTRWSIDFDPCSPLRYALKGVCRGFSQPLGWKVYNIFQFQSDPDLWEIQSAWLAWAWSRPVARRREDRRETSILLLHGPTSATPFILPAAWRPGQVLPPGRQLMGEKASSLRIYLEMKSEYHIANLTVLSRYVTCHT